MITNKQKSKKREISIAKDIGGREHLMSGAAWFKKGDASNEYFLVEDKFTDKEKYSIKYNELVKVQKEALEVSKIPIFRFGFTINKKDYVVLNTKHTLLDATQCDLKIAKKQYTVKPESLYKQDVSLPEGDFIIMTLNFFNKDNFFIVSWENFMYYNNIIYGEFNNEES